jgi:hypothetical protein
MDPIGFGLENYDASGAWRDRDGKFPIDGSGTLPGGVSFNGPQELKQVLRSRSDLFVRNFVEKILTYALGRGLESADRKTVDAIVQHASENGYKFSTVVMEVANSRPFKFRRSEGELDAR